jgi:Ca2+-binding EF-hand superfamily protein
MCVYVYVHSGSLGVSEENCQDLIALLDTNEDGHVERHEFVSNMSIYAVDEQLSLDEQIDSMFEMFDGDARYEVCGAVQCGVRCIVQCSVL